MTDSDHRPIVLITGATANLGGALAAALARKCRIVATRNMLGRCERFDAVPCFWTEQYDFGLAYVGHAERWDHVDIDGWLDAKTRDCAIAYCRAGKKLVVTVARRDLEGLRTEVEFEKVLATAG